MPDSIEDRARAEEYYANNISPESDYPDGGLWTWKEVDEFASAESERKVREFIENLDFHGLSDDARRTAVAPTFESMFGKKLEDE
jgi:hypothetical protein